MYIYIEGSKMNKESSELIQNKGDKYTRWSILNLQIKILNKSFFIKCTFVLVFLNN